MKVVLLSYLDRNKLVKVPEDKSESDVEYLKNLGKSLHVRIRYPSSLYYRGLTRNRENILT